MKNTEDSDLIQIVKAAFTGLKWAGIALGLLVLFLGLAGPELVAIGAMSRGCTVTSNGGIGGINSSYSTKNCP